MYGTRNTSKSIENMQHRIQANQYLHEIISVVPYIFCNMYVDSGAQFYYRHISGQTMESPNGKLSEEKKNRLSKLEEGIKEQVTLDVIHNSTCSTSRYSQPTRSLFHISRNRQPLKLSLCSTSKNTSNCNHCIFMLFRMLTQILLNTGTNSWQELFVKITISMTTTVPASTSLKASLSKLTSCTPATF